MYFALNGYDKKCSYSIQIQEKAFFKNPSYFRDVRLAMFLLIL